MTTGGTFAIWITGLPASGKSTIASALVSRLASQGTVPAVLESDEMRKILCPDADYTVQGRDRFYRQMALIAAMLVSSHIPVLIDATANLRSYRDHLRSLVERFVEVYVDCPLEVCRARDPKGIYAAASSGCAKDVPGIQAPYEPPRAPDVTIACGQDPALAAMDIVRKLQQRRYI